jgi:hypothetical protein
VDALSNSIKEALSSSSDSGSGDVDTSVDTSADDTGIDAQSDTTVDDGAVDHQTSGGGGDDGDDPAQHTQDDAPVIDKKPVDKKPVDKAPEATDGITDEEFEKEFGVKPKRANGKVNLIPSNRVSASLKRVRTEFETERTQFQGEIETRDRTISAMDGARQLISSDAVGFMKKAAKMNPQFGHVLDIVESYYANGGKHQQVHDDGNAVEADLTYTDGRKGYSADAVSKLLARQAAQLEQKFTQTLDSRFAPLVEAGEAAQAEAQLDQQANAIAQYTREWPGFKENEKEILAEIVKDTRRVEPMVKIHNAYLKVAIPKIEAAAGQKVLSGKKRSTSVGSRTAADTGGGDNLSLNDKIKAGLRNLE